MCVTINFNLHFCIFVIGKLTGDIAAHKIGEITRKTLSEAKKQSINLAEMLSEYWQEEQPLLAKKRHVEQFYTQVDTIKSDVARFEKRLNKLAKSLESNVN